MCIRDRANCRVHDNCIRYVFVDEARERVACRFWLWVNRAFRGDMDKAEHLVWNASDEDVDQLIGQLRVADF